MPAYHLAQINIAQALEPLESARLSGFVARLDEINALAERSPGFVWRLVGEAGDATALRVFDHPDMLINMSVWKDLASLRQFVYRSTHRELLQSRHDWFEAITSPAQALWWIAAGEVPDVALGKKKLVLLEERGPSSEVFTFAQPFDPPSEAE